jgi:hypothetical protein
MRFVNRLAAALVACALVATPALANDLNQSTWSETDSSNNAASPNGWTSGTMLPSQVEPTARAMMGAIRRWADQIQPTVTSGGTANAQTLTHTVAHTALVAGDTFSFIVGTSLTNTGSTTLNIDSLGAVTIKRNGANLVGGELQAGQVATVAYDGTNFQLVSPASGQSLATNGYIVLPGGLYVQWGQAAFGGQSSVGVTFPVAFPTAVFTVYATAGGTGGNLPITAGNTSTSGFNAYTNASTSAGLSWLAIGR